MRNICLLIAFDGTDYSGWQKQHHASTIQGEIEARLKRLSGKEIPLHGAGRTDAGVHADGMTAHFHTDTRLTCNDFHRALNRMLPDAIRIVEVREMADDFHARFAATGKEYHYRVFTGGIMPPHKRFYMLHQSKPINREAMQLCLQTITGTHDFSSFENTGSRDKTRTDGKGAVRTIREARYEQFAEDSWHFVFIGDGFLRNMVRNIVGSILEVGRGKESPEWFEQALKAKDRNAAGPTAPAHGLKLFQVFY